MQEFAGTVLPDSVQGAGNIPGIIKTPTRKYQSLGRRKKRLTRLVCEGPVLSLGTAPKASLS